MPDPSVLAVFCLAALALLATLPLVVLFLVATRQIVAGLTAGIGR